MGDADDPRNRIDSDDEFRPFGFHAWHD